MNPDTRPNFEEEYEAIQRCLARLLDDSGAVNTLLVDQSGQLIALAGEPLECNVKHFASLCASVFSTAGRLSALLGEQRFSNIFHNGDSSSIYVMAVVPRVILVVVFGVQTNLGLIRVFAQRSVKELEHIIVGIFDKLRVKN